MTSYTFPAKTFLVGEYVAVLGGPAMVLTTTPCFGVGVVDGSVAQAVIHPESPAGVWWSRQQSIEKHLTWHDPYHGLGGVGASSAQFLGAYAASCALLQAIPSDENLLEAYYSSSWKGQGTRPSGYDVLAQARHGCVYISQNQHVTKCFNWVFDDIGFILVHSGQKLKTHEHLLQLDLSWDSMRDLFIVAESAYQAFEQADSHQLIVLVNEYHQLLLDKHLVASHSLACLSQFKADPIVLAAKGCGAMGADVLLLIVQGDQLKEYRQKLHSQGWNVIADNHDLYQDLPFIADNL